MDNLFQLPCEFQYHLIIPSMLTGLQVVWEAYGTPVLFYKQETLIHAFRNSRQAENWFFHLGYKFKWNNDISHGNVSSPESQFSYIVA